MSLSVIPVLVRRLGAESYGLIGCFASIQALLSILDLGIGGTLTREVARLRTKAPRELADVARTYECIYWLIGIVGGVFIGACVVFGIGSWVKPIALTSQTITRSMCIAIFALIIQWPSTIYFAGLVGLEAQLAANIATIAATTVRTAGAAAVVIFISPTLEAYFVCQLFAAVLQTSLTYHLFWARVRKESNSSPRFQLSLALQQWKYSATLSVTSVIIVIQNQVDKIVLSGFLPLKTFGYYMVAFTMAQSLYLLGAPLGDAFFPRFAALVGEKRETELRSLYSVGFGSVSLIIIPVGCVLAVFSKEILQLWTKNPELVNEVWSVATLLCVASCLNIITSTLDLLQMAYGWLKPALLMRTFGLVVGAPMLCVLSYKFGVIGASISWVLVNTVSFVILPIVVLRRLVPGYLKHWYATCTKVAAIAGVITIFVKIYVVHNGTNISTIAVVGLAWITAVGGSALSISYTRKSAREVLARFTPTKRLI